MPETKRSALKIGAAAIVVALIAVSLIALRTASDRSERADALSSELDRVQGERDQLATERTELETQILEAESETAIVESRWLAAVAISGDHAPVPSRLIAVEAASRNPTPEAMGALGNLLFADARTEPPIVELDHQGPVWVTAASSSTDVVATGSDDDTVKVWSSTGDLLTTMVTPGRVRAVDFSGDGQRIASGSADGTAAVWTVSGDEVASTTHSEQVNHVVLTADGAVMISAGHDGLVRITDAGTGETRRQFDHGDVVWKLALSVDEQRVVSGGQDGATRVWDLETGDELQVFDLGEPVTVVEFSPDGQWLFAGGQRGTALLVDVADGETGLPLVGAFRGGFVDMDWHPGGEEMALVSLGGIHRFQLSTRELLVEHQLAGGARGVAYGPDGTWFATASGDFQFSFGEIAFWDAASGAKLLSLNLGGPVESIATHHTGAVLASFRSVEDLVEVGGAWLVPGLDEWVALACEGSDGVIGEQTWRELTGEPTSHTVGCP